MVPLDQIPNLLQEAYQEAVRKKGLIDYTDKLRGSNNDASGKTSINFKDVDSLFKSKDWQEQETRSGHRKIRNLLTGVTIEYRNHGNFDTGAAVSILNATQTHLNILCNDVFAYKIDNWKKPPDFAESAKRYAKWKERTHTHLN